MRQQPTSTGTAIYEINQAGVRLGAGRDARQILSDLSMRVDESEIVGIVGRSGTGKTTLMRALSGLVRVNEGELKFDGKPLNGPNRDVVTVFQDYGNALLPWRNVFRNVALPLEGHYSRAEIKERVTDAINVVGLAGREKDYLKSLSGGMQQRVQIARALVLEPRVLLMDEPFGALDAMTKASLQDTVLRLHAATRTTIIFITHDLDEAIYLSDKIYVISGQPGTFSLELAVDLPRPRDQIDTRELPAYIDARHQLGEALELHGKPSA